MSNVKLQGSLVALVTPMLADGEIDWHRLDKLVDMHIDSGTHGLVPAGTTGESATLSVSEHAKVIESVVKRADGRVPVVAGTGANSTSEAIKLTLIALNAGADACLLIAPYYNKPTQEGLYRHYMTIADAADIPQLLYNVPSRTACDLLPETVCRLAVHPNIIGIKEATGQVDRVTLILRDTDNFIALSGEDAKNFELIQAGAIGCISVTANVAPTLMAKFCNAALAGDLSAARAYDDCLQGLHAALFVESNPIPAKWALQRMGLIESGIRLPLTPLSTAAQDTVENSLKGAGILA